MKPDVSTLPRLSPSELNILIVLWKLGRASSAKEIYYTMLPEDWVHHEIAFMTFRTYLNRAIKKGYICKEGPIKDYKYGAIFSRSEVNNHLGTLAELKRIVELLRLTLPDFIGYFYKVGKLTREDKTKVLKFLAGLSEDDLPL